MRVWTLDERGRICLDGSPYWWTLTEGDGLRLFIVDALNAHEPREKSGCCCGDPRSHDYHSPDGELVVTETGTPTTP